MSYLQGRTLSLSLGSRSLMNRFRLALIERERALHTVELFETVHQHVLFVFHPVEAEERDDVLLLEELSLATVQDLKCQGFVENVRVSAQLFQLFQDRQRA